MIKKVDKKEEIKEQPAKKIIIQNTVIAPIKAEKDPFEEAKSR
jgi:hypothetical protein